MIGHEDLSFFERPKQEQVEKNRFLDEYNGRPTLEKIKQLILQKRQNGDSDRRISVSVEWALEMLDFFTSNTNFTWQMAHDAPRKLRDYEDRMLKAETRANLEHQKAQELLIENTLVYERLEQIVEKLKELESADKDRIIKLPLNRVNSFMLFCKQEQLESPTEHFYIKIDDKGNMLRIVRTPEELN